MLKLKINNLLMKIDDTITDCPCILSIIETTKISILLFLLISNIDICIKFFYSIIALSISVVDFNCYLNEFTLRKFKWIKNMVYILCLSQIMITLFYLILNNYSVFECITHNHMKFLLSK